jgi:hypothetical protein
VTDHLTVARGTEGLAVARRPDRLAVDLDGRLPCPRLGDSDRAECRGCPYLQGTLEFRGVEVLCAYRWGAPALSRRAIAIDAGPEPEAVP